MRAVTVLFLAAAACQPLDGSQGTIGPQGPAGEPGAQGPAGPMGAPGRDGVAGVSSKSGTRIKARVAQWATGDGLQHSYPAGFFDRTTQTLRPIFHDDLLNTACSFKYFYNDANRCMPVAPDAEDLSGTEHYSDNACTQPVHLRDLHADGMTPAPKYAVRGSTAYPVMAAMTKADTIYSKLGTCNVVPADRWDQLLKQYRFYRLGAVLTVDRFATGTYTESVVP